MTRHAFVTGAGGYVGRHLVRELVAAGWTVTGLVRRSDQTVHLDQLGARPVLGDLRDPELQVKGIAEDTFVFHLAASLTTWSTGVEEGRSMTENILRLMATCGCSRLIMVSSASVHRPRHADNPVNDSVPLGPHPQWNHYVQQKLVAEALVRRAHEAGRLSPTIIRPSRVIGPGDPRLMSWAAWISTWIAGALAEDRSQRLPVVVVGELARGLVACAQSPQTVGRAYYLSSRTQITRGDLLDAFVAAGMPLPRRSLARSSGLAAARIAFRTLEAYGGTGPRAMLIAALERRAGMAVGHDCAIDCSTATADFGWLGLDDIETAIEQSVRWHFELPEDHPDSHLVA